MENKRRSKRIEKQNLSPVTTEHDTEDKNLRQIRSDIAKIDAKLSSIVKMIPDAKEISTTLSLLEKKFDSIGRVVYGGKPKIQKLVEDVEVIRSDNDANTDMLCDLALSQDRLDSLCNVILKMHDTLKTIAEAQGIHLEAFESTTSFKSKAPWSGTVMNIADNSHPAMQDHVKKMKRKMQRYRRPRGMSIKTFAREMTQLYQEICTHGGHLDQNFLKHNFINGLGRPFKDIYMHLLHDTLPPEWQPLDLDELVPVAEKYLNEKPSSSSRKRKYSDSDDNSD